MEKVESRVWGVAPPKGSAYERYLKLIKAKPAVPGKVVKYQFLPPRGYWGGAVGKGQVIRIIDLEGQQDFDLIFYDAHNINNRLSTGMSMIKEEKWDKWRPGDGVWSRNLNKLAMLSEDTSEGHHAFYGCFCNSPQCRVIDGIPNQHNCHDNLISAMRTAGFPDFSAKDLDWGSCISVFCNLTYNLDGSIGVLPPTTKPGDYIDFLAEMDLIVTISNCPSETSPVNNWMPTALFVVIFEPSREYVDKGDELRQAKEAEYSKSLALSEDEYRELIDGGE